MRIAFIGSFSENSVCGVSNATYANAKGLVQKGHEVFFYSNENGDSSYIYKDKNGIKKRCFKSKSLFRSSLDFTQHVKDNIDNIDIYHLSSVFTPYNYAVARTLKKFGYSYILTPHNGYNKKVFLRHFLKKNIYYHLFEKFVLTNASGIHCISENEVSDVKILKYNGQIKLINNPVTCYNYRLKKEDKAAYRYSLTYLGRYDIYCKGLDRLFSIQKHIELKNEDIYLNLYGDGKDRENLNLLKHRLGLKNVMIHDPVFGTEKEKVYQNSTLYIQTSRWEGSPVSIADAMLRKVPVAVTSGCNMDSIINKWDAGVILKESPEAAADQIITFLNTRKALRKCAENGFKFAEQNYKPEVTTKRIVDFYHEVLN
ncbi:Glycosyltransferase [Chitinispirillum alkaliphilum]|nr:Glycosyltransferase [Chitinispirillum alkaliphilum]